MALQSSQSGCIASELEEQTLLCGKPPENDCRLCRESDDQNMGQISPLAGEVQFVTNLTVADDDGLSALICYRCIYELKQASAFIRRSVANDVALRSEQTMQQAQLECSDVKQPTPTSLVTVMYEDPLNLSNSEMALLKEEPDEYVISEVDEMSSLVDDSADDKVATVECLMSQAKYESQETAESDEEGPALSNWYSIPFGNSVAHSSNEHKLLQAPTSNSNESYYIKDRKTCPKKLSCTFSDKATQKSDFENDKGAEYLSSLKNFAHHASFEHSLADVFMCFICDKKLASLYMLNMHKKLHEQIDRFKCETCEREFISAAVFKCHLRTHAEKNLYICCNRRFINAPSLHLHIRDHITEVSLERVETIVDIRNESDKIQGGVEVFYGNRLRTAKNNTMGQDKSCGTSQRKNNSISYKCKDCNNSFNLKMELSMHVTSCHRAEDKSGHIRRAQGASNQQRSKPPSVSQAKVKRTASKRSVILKGIKHVNRKTDVVRVRTLKVLKKCRICSKWILNMAPHIKTHSVNNRAHCKMCGRSFSRVDTLRGHEKRHLGLEPKTLCVTYKCLECLKVFALKRYLKQHSTKIHNLE